MTRDDASLSARHEKTFMTSQTQSILQALFDEEPLPTPDCGPCQDLLPAYVDATLAGGDAAATFPDVSVHLAGCTTCSAVYDELAALLALEQSGKLAAPPVAAAFDFSYLPAPSPQPATAAQPSARPWRVDALGRLIIQFSEELLRSLQGPALQPSYLKGDAPQPLTIAIDDEVDDLAVHISAEPTRRNVQLVDVEVDVDIPSRGGWPNLAGSVITLSIEDAEFDRQETDAFGKALFEGVPREDIPAVTVVVDPRRMSSAEQEQAPNEFGA